MKQNVFYSESQEDIDERAGDLLPSVCGQVPDDERALEIAEQLADACPWLRSVGAEQLMASIRRVAEQRVCGAAW